jgi:hypothetical protein
VSSDDYDDEFYDDEEDEEEWEYFEEEEKVPFRDRVSIKDIIKLVLLFVVFAAFFLYFRYWDSLVTLLSFGSEDLGRSRLLYATLVLFPLLGALFLKFLVDVSRTLFIPPKETVSE